MSRPSSLLRAVRVMTAVITVWCVGCSGFDPLLDAAVGAGASVMTCGADRAPLGGATSTASADGAHGKATVSAVTAAHVGFDCGCGSCHSAALSVWTLQPAPHIAPAMAVGRIGVLLSIVRAPLLPPPQDSA